MSDICREFGISETGLYICEKKHSSKGLGSGASCGKKNGKFKWLVADLSPDRHILQVVAKKPYSQLDAS